ncbi:MAG TPA: hypothetical protein PLE44_01325 [Bacilli bacterium]|nr:hypothetical protein [Bacilli bacterium]
MKKETARLGVIYASNKLGLEDGIEVLYRDRDFFQFDHQGAIFIPATYTIVFNTDWLNSIHDEEILRCAFHETRHAYQRACIDFPDMMILDVPEETVKKRVVWVRGSKVFSKNQNFCITKDFRTVLGHLTGHEGLFILITIMDYWPNQVNNPFFYNNFVQIY